MAVTLQAGTVTVRMPFSCLKSVQSAMSTVSGASNVLCASIEPVSTRTVGLCLLLAGHTQFERFCIGEGKVRHSDEDTAVFVNGWGLMPIRQLPVFVADVAGL